MHRVIKTSNAVTHIIGKLYQITANLILTSVLNSIIIRSHFILSNTSIISFGYDMGSPKELSVCYQNRGSEYQNEIDIVPRVRLEEPSGSQIEEGFRNVDETFSARIKNLPFALEEKYGNTTAWCVLKNWLNVLLITSLLLIFILAGCSIAKQFTTNKKQFESSVKCNICGKGVQFHTMLGDVFGNVCNDSFSNEITIHDCGKESACFSMNVNQSKDMRYYLVHLKESLKNISHPYSKDPLLHEGTIKGCLNGLIWEERCHFFNTSMFFPNQSTSYWTATNLCTCTSDNCN